MADIERTVAYRRGFPQQSGAYLVRLSDDEYLVTWYQSEPRSVDDDRTGWICLTGSHATVTHYADIPRI